MHINIYTQNKYRIFQVELCMSTNKHQHFILTQDARLIDIKIKQILKKTHLEHQLTSL